MKSPGIASDRDAIVDQLAQLDLSDPGDVSRSPEPPSTVRELKAELDTLLGQLREPAGPDPFAEETGLRRAQELVRAIGVEYGPPAKDERPELGRIGPYELLAKLGEGGMGAVYKALHSSLEKVVALKVLPRERLHPDAIARFKREMKAVGKLDHPNIVRATDAGEADGDHFLVMEYVDGLDLSQLLRRVGPLAAADACELVRQAAVGLQHAHQRGMVHRDIKPNNIMLTWGDEHVLGAGLPTPPSIKILDMGLALLSEPVASPHGDLTTTGQMMGTIEYMSPEQGLDTHNVDIRSDIYSLGATLYKLLCGKAPFSGAQYNTPGKMLVALATETPASIGTQRSDLPAGLVAVVNRMLAKDPAERYRAPAEVAQALAPFAAGADLPRLSATARQQAGSADTATGKMASTEEFLSSPHTDTQNQATVPYIQEQPSPAAPRTLLARIGELPYFRPAMIATAAALLILAAAVVYRIQTDQGTFVVKIEGDEAQAILEKDGLIVRDKNSDRTWTIKAAETKPLPRGDYQLEGAETLEMLVTEDSGAEVKTREFTLKRKGEVRVVVTLQRDAKIVAKTSATSDPDRRAAEWVLLIGGGIKIKENGQARQIGAIGDLPKGVFELTDVNLTSSPKVNDAGLAHFQDCKNLLQLDLGGTQLTDAGLAHFKDCQNLTYLRLAGTKVSDAGLAHFKDCKNLATLSLEWSGVGDAGLAYFKDCQNLSSLNLSGIRVSDAGLANFAGCPKLGSVFVKNTKITEAGVKKLSAALPACKIEWDGGVIEPTIAADPDRRAAEWVLSIGGGISITENGQERPIAAVGDLPTGPFELEAVNLGNNQKVTVAGLAHFKDCKNLTVLDLGRSQVTDAGLAHFKGCLNLSHLSLMQTKVSDAGLAHFKDCKNLTYLDLVETRLTDAGLAHFKDCKYLKVLNLGYTRVSGAGLAHFKDCKNLTLLNLYATQVGDTGLAYLKDCKNLTALDLAATQVSDAGLTQLNDYKSLLQVILLRTKVTTAGIDDLKKALPLCKIEWDGGVIEPTLAADPDRRAAEWVLSIGGTIHISENGRERAIQAVSDLPRGAIELTVVDLNNNPKVTNAGLARFKDCKNLTGLTLHHTQVSNAGLVHFLDCKNLAVLNLAYTIVSDAGLANFKNCKNLTNLNLYHTEVSDAGLANFKDCRNLMILFLYETQVSDAGLAHLKDYKNLAHVNLQKTKVTAAGIDELTKALPQCKIEWDGGVIEPTIAADPDRRAAEWVLSIGGGISIKENDQERQLGAAADLPQGPFELTVVNLTSNSKVSDAGLANFKDCKNLTSIELAATKVSDAGLVHFKDCKNLKRLVLRHAPVSAAGLIHFKDCKYLTYLDLDDTKVSDAGLAHFKDCKNLTHLSLNTTLVRDAWLVHFKDCKNLTVLSLGNAGYVGDAGLAHFKDCKNLTGLVLHGTQVSDAGLAHVKDCTNLTSLVLAATQVSDAGLAHFKDCKNLTYLDLSVPKVSDAGLVHFKDCKNLTGLVLSTTQVSDAGLAYFKDRNNLTLIDLNRTKVSDAGLAHFKDCKDLIDLRLGETQLTDAGLAHLKDCKNLTNLILAGTQVSDAGLAHLPALAKLGSVNVIRTKVTEAGVKKLSAALPGCKIEWDGGVIEPTVAAEPDRRAAEWVLSIGGTIGIKENGKEQQIGAVGDLPPSAFEFTVADLYLNPKVNDAGLDHFKGCKNLRYLTLGGFQISNAGLAHLKDCTNLNHFALYNDTLVNDAGLSQLKNCKNLTSLILSGAQVSDAGLAHFKDRTNLQVIDLRDTQVSDAGLTYFKDCRNLIRLYLSGTKLTDVGLAHLKQCTTLQIIDLRDTKVSDAGLIHIKDCKHLNYLDLGKTQVSDAGLADLAGCPKLAFLTVQNTKVTEAGVKKLAAALPGCKIEWDGGVIEPAQK